MPDVWVQGSIKIVATFWPPPAGVKTALYTDYVQSWLSFLDQHQNTSVRRLLSLQERFHLSPMGSGAQLSITITHGIVNKRLLEQWLTLLHEDLRIVGKVTLVTPAYGDTSANRKLISIKWTFNEDGSLDKEKGQVPASARYTI